MAIAITNEAAHSTVL